MTSMQEYVSRRTRQAMEDVIRTAERVPEDKRQWQPLGEGRTVLSFVQECAEVNERWATVLKEGVWSEWPQETTIAYFAAMPTMAHAIQGLRRATQNYLDVIEKVPTEKLDVTIELPWGVFTYGECLMHAIWHMSYHEGQINYVQTLYGDWEE